MLPIIMAIESEEDRLLVESLYIKYKGKLKHIAYQILKNDDDAQDCVHETIVTVIDKLERYRENADDENLKWMIMTACRNKAIDKYRKNKRKNMLQQSLTSYDSEDDEDVVQDIPDFHYNPENIVISEENYQFLICLVNRLDDKYRDPILLKYRGLENRDVAEILGISENLVRKRLQRAKEKIMIMGGDRLYAKHSQ